MRIVFSAKRTKGRLHKEKIFVSRIAVASFAFLVVSLGWPLRPAGASLLAQPSPRPTIDLTGTALAQPTNPPGPTNTPLPPGPTNPPPTGGQPSATRVPPTATPIRPRATTTQPPTTEPPTATERPTSTATAAPPTEIPPSQTPFVIYITTTPQPGGGVVIITVIPTLRATAVQPETPQASKANWDWLGWLVLLVVLGLLAIPLMWLARRKFMLPAMYPARGRPRSTGVRAGRGRERRS